ncbi:hypothetical protein D9M73_68530 [compost metagenome]
MRRKDTQLLGVVHRLAGHQLDAVTLGEPAIDDAHQHDHAHISVVPAVDDHRAQRCIRIALGRRNSCNDRLKNFIDAHAGLGTAGDGVGRVDADDLFNFLLGILGISLRQIHLVEHRHNFNAEVECGVAVGNGLRFNTLACIDNQQRAFTCRQRTAHFIREVNVARCVDQIEVVDLAIKCLVFERSGLCLDGYPTLFFNVHRVKHLRTHLAILQATTSLDESIRERGLAVINVRNDRKISDVIHQRERLST